MTVKHVYLDQNQWIYLAKDYWGKPHKQQHAGISQWFLKMVNSDRIRLPLSTIHFIEHLRADSSDRRQRLAKVFDLFSHRWYMASWSLILPVEIRQAVSKTFGGHQIGTPLQVFGRGFLFGLGQTERELLRESRIDSDLEFLEQIVSLPGAILDLLTFSNEPRRKEQNQKILELNNTNANAAEKSRQTKRHNPLEVHRRIKYAEYTLHRQDLLIPALAAVGRTPDDFLSLGRERLMSFWASVPSLDVDCELTLYRDRQWSRQIQANDFGDIWHLALALPYCDVVVTERFWTRAAMDTKVDQKYGTVVCSDLAEVIDLVN